MSGLFALLTPELSIIRGTYLVSSPSVQGDNQLPRNVTAMLGTREVGLDRS
ncbi:hypothetical protein GCM10022419_024470 [Nonomuraea rosea]|uniref:Uncharacterized protein n=1 Tax=Nonomuraea rosea TaxID=638574 RepID=A0ABP6W322_9ACTN